MDKLSVINEILRVYEENNNLKNEINFLKNKSQQNNNIENKENDLKEKVYRIGLATLFEECFKGTYIGRWGDDSFPSLEAWSDSNITLNGIYEEISQKEFKDLFGDKIKNAYDKAINKAMERERNE